MTEHRPEHRPEHDPEAAAHAGDVPASTGAPTPDVDRLPAGDPVRAVFRRALRDMLVLVAVLAVVGVGVGAAIAGAAGVWGAVLGVGVALVFSGSTVLAMLLTARSSFTTASGALVGSWLAKTLLLIIAFSLLRDLDFYDRGVFAVVVLVGVLGSVLLDFRAVTSARVPYVDPAPRS